VKLVLGKRVECADLGNFHHVIVATGIVPRALDVPGSQHSKVASYTDIVSGRRIAGSKVAIVGAGGIGFDVAELLTASSPHDGHASDGSVDDPAIAQFREEWGIDANFVERGGLGEVHEPAPARQVWLLQRKSSKVGEGLAKTTGWIKRTLLKKRGVKMLSGVEYVNIDDAGLHIRVGGQPQLLDVDTIVVCAGQEPRRDIVDCLRSMGISHTLVGGADIAAELDAKRAIEQGTRVALSV
jgi:2,4-dienoyl-CoA reductase (NADPH2)